LHVIKICNGKRINIVIDRSIYEDMKDKNFHPVSSDVSYKTFVVYNSHIFYNTTSIFP